MNGGFKEIVEIISLIMGVVVIALVVRYAGGVSQIVEASGSSLNSIINDILGGSPAVGFRAPSVP